MLSQTLQALWKFGRQAQILEILQEMLLPTGLVVCGGLKKNMTDWLGGKVLVAELVVVSGECRGGGHR